MSDLFPSDSSSDSGSSDSASSSSSSSSGSSSSSAVGGRKRARNEDNYPIPKRLRRFLDIEAGEGDEEEDESELDEEGLAERRAVRQRELERLRREVATRKKAGTHRLKTVIEQIEERARQGDATGMELAPVEEAAISEAGSEEGVVSRMPTLEDDKLFMVKVNESGKERQIIAQLITKAAATRETSCKSFFTTDAVRGFIYVEAPSEGAVRKFFQGIRSVQSYSAKIVPFNEQLAVFKAAVKAAADKVTTIAIDSWVRIKRHAIYGGDLARVKRDLGEDGLELLLVPRVDVEAIRRGRGLGPQRPTPTFFDRIYPEISDLTERVKDKELGEYVYQVNGDQYTESGYLIKRFARKNVADAHATIAEVRAFVRDVVTEDQVRAMLGEKIHTRTNFHLGERVRVVTGDLRGVEGVIKEIFADRGRVAVATTSVKNLKTLEFGLAEVSKVWNAGEHVVVTSGDDEGETGMVVKTDSGGSVVVLLDGDQRELTIEGNILKMASEEKAVGETTVEGISVGDLVVLRSSITGVVIRLSKSGKFLLLGTQGEKVSGHVHEVTNKRPNQRGAFGVSKHGDAFGLGSSVKVGNGEGEVVYMVGAVVFARIKGKTSDAGFLVVKSGEVEVLHVQDMARPKAASSGGSPVTFVRGGGGGGPIGGSSAPSLGKVRIIKGTYKGYTGTIRDMQDTKVQVSLDAKFKVVTLPKDQVRAIDSEASSLAPPPMMPASATMSSVGLSSAFGSLYRPPSTVQMAEPKTPAIFEEVEEEQKPWWLSAGICVDVMGTRGEVVRVEASEGRARVKIHGEMKSVKFSECTRTQPKQGDRVRVMGTGSFHGLQGELMGYQTGVHDAVILDEEGEVKVVDAREVVVLC